MSAHSVHSTRQRRLKSILNSCGSNHFITGPCVLALFHSFGFVVLCMAVNGQLCVFSFVLLFLPLVFFVCQDTASTSRYQNESENDQSHQRLNTHCRLYYFVKLGVPTLIGQIPRHRNDRSYYYFKLMFPDCSDQVLFFELVRIGKIPFLLFCLPTHTSGVMLWLIVSRRCPSFWLIFISSDQHHEILLP